MALSEKTGEPDHCPLRSRRRSLPKPGVRGQEAQCLRMEAPLGPALHLRGPADPGSRAAGRHPPRSTAAGASLEAGARRASPRQPRDLCPTEDPLPFLRSHPAWVSCHPNPPGKWKEAAADGGALRGALTPSCFPEPSSYLGTSDSASWRLPPEGNTPLLLLSTLRRLVLRCLASHIA